MRAGLPLAWLRIVRRTVTASPALSALPMGALFSGKPRPVPWIVRGATDMIYSEAAYFDGAHVAHIAAWVEVQRLARIEARNRAALRTVERRKGGRAWRNA